MKNQGSGDWPRGRARGRR